MTLRPGADVAGLIERVAEAATVYINGDVRTYLSLITHARDFTPVGPLGGELVRGFDDSPEAIEQTGKFFESGQAELNVLEQYVSADMVVLVVVERQRGKVGCLPEQDWSLRVTLVFRREGSGWVLVHRHADPLVHAITFQRLSDLAAGW